MRYEILPGTADLMTAVGRNLRADDRAELEAFGLEPCAMLRRLAGESLFCKGAIVDGLPAAAWGCAGPMLSATGQMWLFTTPVVERVPMAFVKEARKAIAEVVSVKTSLVTSCLASYEKSLRLWAMLGFTVGDAYCVKGGAVFRHLRMER